MCGIGEYEKSFFVELILSEKLTHIVYKQKECGYRQDTKLPVPDKSRKEFARDDRQCGIVDLHC